MGRQDAPNHLPEPTGEAEPEPGTVGQRERVTAWLRRNSTHALVVGVVVAVTGAVAPLAATGAWNEWFGPEPAKCPGAGCEGKNPNVEGCGADARTYERRSNNVARVQVRYSPRCGAAWGRIVNGEVGDKVTIMVRGGGASEGVIETHHDQFTKMVTVTDSFSVKVCAVPTTKQHRSATWDHYCVHATEKTTWSI